MSAITIDWVRVAKANEPGLLEQRINAVIEGQDDYETLTVALAQSEDEDTLHCTALLHFTHIQDLGDEEPQE